MNKDGRVRRWGTEERAATRRGMLTQECQSIHPTRSRDRTGAGFGEERCGWEASLRLRAEAGGSEGIAPHERGKGKQEAVGVPLRVGRGEQERISTNTIVACRPKGRGTSPYLGIGHPSVLYTTNAPADVACCLATYS